MSKGILIAGVSSGSGKTTFTLGLLSALACRGISVAPFKVGPDFIDPGHHGRIAGRPGRNLDGWMLSREYNRSAFDSRVRPGEVAVVEGVMGLFDGYDGRTEAGSTAQMAKWLGLPVLLVVDARSMARSAAALVQGFERFDPELTFAGVFFNRLGSERHLEYLREALEAHVKMPFLGGMLKDDRLALPERHLGLVTSEDHPLEKETLALLARTVEERLDLDRLLESLPELPAAAPETVTSPPPATARIGVARDQAFCFYYEDNLDLLRRHGAELVFFSPLRDQRLPHDLDGIYLGGGYPELHAGKLSENRAMQHAIRQSAANGMPVYGECGGFMYLCQSLRDASGGCWPMAGVFPFTTSMHARLRSLGYREITLTADTILGPVGEVLRGHEFHYSEICEGSSPTRTVYSITPRGGREHASEGFQVNRALGSYIHLHFGSRPEAAGHLVAACRRFRSERKSTS